MKVKFIPQNLEFEIKPGESVMHVAQDHGLYVKSVCKGVPSCAECRVRVVEGDYNVLPPGSEELALIGTGYFIDSRRLSCQLKCFGDITVDMSEQIAKQQGLIGKKSKRAALQGDRIEEQVTRTSTYDDDPDPSSSDYESEARAGAEGAEESAGAEGAERLDRASGSEGTDRAGRRPGRRKGGRGSRGSSGGSRRSSRK